jgi:hypothetical protein
MKTITGRFARTLAGLALTTSLAALSATAIAAPPELTGVWGHAFPRPGVTVDPRLMPPPPAEPALTAAYAEDYRKLRAAEKASDHAGQPLANASTQCLPDGMPQMMFAIYPLEILQTPGQVTIIEEAYSQVRRVYLDKPQMAIDDVPPGYFGHSVGRWDGDVLVVDTIGIKEQVKGFQDLPHSDQMHIEERLRLLTPDILQDQVTITDPKALAKPWTFTFAYQRMRDYQMMEYVCENNREYVDKNGVTQVRLGGQ